jgi:hypothetical protein
MPPSYSARMILLIIDFFKKMIPTLLCQTDIIKKGEKDVEKENCGKIQGHSKDECPLSVQLSK